MVRLNKFITRLACMRHELSKNVKIIFGLCYVPENVCYIIKEKISQYQQPVWDYLTVLDD